MHDSIDRLVTGGALGSRLFGRLLDREEEMAAPAGTIVGRWRIVQFLGAGGSAHVYLAERCDRRFGQQVALKVLKPDPALAARFRREREIAASLRHPNLVPLIDGGETDDGRSWFAMMPVFGVPIDEHVDRGALPWQHRVSLVDAVAGAVAHAHAQGLVHRDIKPANVLVDADGHPRLLDFGIATSARSRRTPLLADLSATLSGDALMTPDYASPEQLAGRPVTAASDIYQLGLLLDRVVGRVRVPAIVEQELREIVARATAVRPEDRYADVAALRADFAAVVARRPVSAVRRWSLRLRAFHDRHRARVAVAGAALALAAALVGTLAVRWQTERAAAQAEAARAERMRDLLGTLIDAVRDADDPATADRLLRDGIARVEARVGDDAVERAVFAAELGRAYGELGRFHEARDVLDRALLDARARLPAEAPEHASLVLEAAWVAYRVADYPRAVALHDEAEALVAHIAGDRQRELRRAKLANQRAVLAKRTGRLDEAWLLQRAAVDGFERWAGPQELDTARALNNLGLLAAQRGDRETAVEELERAAGIHAAKLGDAHVVTLQTLDNLAGVLADVDPARAASIVERELAALAQKWPGDHPTTAVALNQLASIRIRQGRLRDAREHANASLAMQRRLYGESHPFNGFPLLGLGRAALLEGDVVAARDAYERSLVQFERAHGPDHPDVASALEGLGSVRLASDDVDGAQQALRRALALRAKHLPARHVATARARLLLAEALLADGSSRHANEAALELGRARESLASTRDPAPDERALLARLTRRFVDDVPRADQRVPR